MTHLSIARPAGRAFALASNPAPRGVSPGPACLRAGGSRSSCHGRYGDAVRLGSASAEPATPNAHDTSPIARPVGRAFALASNTAPRGVSPCPAPRVYGPVDPDQAATGGTKMPYASAALPPRTHMTHPSSPIAQLAGRAFALARNPAPRGVSPCPARLRASGSRPSRHGRYEDDVCLGSTSVERTSHIRTHPPLQG